MRVHFLTITINLAIIVGVMGLSIPLTDPKPMVAMAEQTYTLGVTEGENESIDVTPGEKSDTDMVEQNTCGYESWIFTEVTFPTLPADELVLESGEDAYNVCGAVPLLRYTPNDGWFMVEEEQGENFLRRVWMYETSVSVESECSPLFDVWELPNLRAANGISGSHSYEEITMLMNNNLVTLRYLQSKGINGTPDQLWDLVR